jgi:BirA family transcriptional regulator, biotin operon repressor / biotin---[acetyl-CoA-carboxylase] ligase
VTRFGAPHLHLRLAGSTNERARGLAEDGAPSGAVVTASEQSAGRGRRGRVWSAPPERALLYSAILRPLGLEHALLPLAVPVAVCEAIEAVAPVACRIKWPNDVWIDAHKVAGVLIEARPPEWAVIGVGLNVSIADGELPADLRWPATSIGHGASVEEALKALNDRLGEWIEAPRGRLLAAYAERDALRGREVAWEGGPPGSQDGHGVAAGIDASGNLLVELESGRRIALGAGEVQLSAG